jgi:hypothetical protein
LPTAALLDVLTLRRKQREIGVMEQQGKQPDDTTTSSQGARWEYGDISLELTVHLIQGQARYAVPTHAGEGLGHVNLKIAVVAHLLHWGYQWDDILWEYDPPNVPGRRRADVFTRGGRNLPSFWFECRTTDNDKLCELRSTLSPDVRLVNVMLKDRFISWWNGDSLRLRPSMSSKERRAAIRTHRAEISVPGVEYWAMHDTSASTRILFAARRDEDDSYTYFDTGEGWSLSWILKLSRRTDCWAPLIPGIVGDYQPGRHDTYLPRRKDIDRGAQRL